MFSIFASPSVRRPLTSAAIWATRGSLLASAIGITAMVVGPRAKIRPGRNIHTASAVHRMASPATEAKAATRRRLKSKKCFAGSLVVSVAAFVSDAAGAGRLTGRLPAPRRRLVGPSRSLRPGTGSRGRRSPGPSGACRRRARCGFRGCTGTGCPRRHGRSARRLPSIAACSGRGRHCAASSRSISRVLGRSLMVSPSGRRNSARSESSSKPEKRSTVPSRRQLSPSSPRIDARKCASNAQARRISEKFQNVSTAISGRLARKLTWMGELIGRLEWECAISPAQRDAISHHVLQPPFPTTRRRRRFAPRRRAGVLRAGCAMCGEISQSDRYLHAKISSPRPRPGL